MSPELFICYSVQYPELHLLLIYHHQYLFVTCPDLAKYKVLTLSLKLLPPAASYNVPFNSFAVALGFSKPNFF